MTGAVCKGVYPNALVTFALVSEIVPDDTVILLPILTPPKTEEVALGSVYFVSVVGGVYPKAEVIAELVRFVKKISPETLVIVDNCYGEFVEKIEPNDVGADLVAGSLIKNIGGGIVPTGGYVAGKEKWVEQVAFRLTSPSIGAEVGSFIGGYLQYFEGLFLAPSVVKNAVRSALLFAKGDVEIKAQCVVHRLASSWVRRIISIASQKQFFLHLPQPMHWGSSTV